MSAKWMGRAAGALVLALAAWLRLAQLDVRPMHDDEAVHAIKLDELLRSGRYVYDPTEYHGPTLYYATLPVAWLRGAAGIRQLDERDLRVVPALFGVGIVALILCLRDALGRIAALSAAALAAVSPALVYYSRDYIQETLLAFFTLALIVAAWRGLRSGSAAASILAGVAAGLMHATKETCVIAFACGGVALLVTLGPYRRALVNRKAITTLNLAILSAVATSALLFSNLGRNWAGPLDSIRTYKTYLNRANAEQVHDHPWDFYIERIGFWHYPPAPVWSELGIVGLAGIGLAAAWRRHGGPGDAKFRRFVAVYALLMTLAYCAIPYKTPWCAIQFLLPLTLLAGVGLAQIIEFCGTVKRRRGGLAARGIVTAGALAVLLHLCWQARQAALNPRWVADNRNPYVYSQPLRDVVDLARYVQRVADASPDPRDVFIRVICDNSWPLPWYLRRFERVGYWEAPPADCDGPIVVVDAERLAAIRQRMRGDYVESMYGLRPREALSVLVRRDLYGAFTAAQGGAPASTAR